MEFWKWMITLCFFITACEAFRYSSIQRDFDDIFAQYKQVYNRKYNKHDEHKRKCNFYRALLRIMKHNFEFDLGKRHYRMGLNKYSDLSHGEFVSRFNGFRGTLDIRRGNRTRRRNRRFRSSLNLPIPRILDWRDQNIVTGVKDQEECGSCWAFSAVAALESQVIKNSNRRVNLSEQNLIDCSSPQGNRGCQGGLMTNAYQYIIDNGGIEAEQTYPYRARKGQCRFRGSRVAATCESFEEVDAEDEEALLEALVDVGPISVGIDGSLQSFQDYRGGVYDDPSCSSRTLDHAVLLTGYGTENGDDYWLIKNSYGTSWGERGYGKIARNSNNMCGLATQASYPIV